ncbi:MAG: indole-3-glycerol phosphate synthase TrpC [Oscillospiraceae bacterium]|jgi:indole-3-glycerol phosphate synthase|nr:indole-3-glycerol phosphate synthase TrpC [Oscillospiraceae bacterium]
MILDELAASARERVAAAKTAEFDFYAALAAPGLSVIAEVKRASPSKGLIAPDFPYLEIAKDYELAGASAISVLTEPTRFLGSDEYLREIAGAVRLPCLRKDFTVDEYQIYEARTLGASAVLLICAILNDAELLRFRELAETLGMAAIAEAHSDTEVRRAVNSGAKIIGINNRNLATFDVDVNTAETLRELIPPDVLFIAESGITSPENGKTLSRLRADAVLIGEALMRSNDKVGFISELRRNYNADLQN